MPINLYALVLGIKMMAKLTLKHLSQIAISLTNPRKETLTFIENNINKLHLKVKKVHTTQEKTKVLGLC